MKKPMPFKKGAMPMMKKGAKKKGKKAMPSKKSAADKREEDLENEPM